MQITVKKPHFEAEVRNSVDILVQILKKGFKLIVQGYIDRPRIIEPQGELTEATKNLESNFYFKFPTTTMDQLMDEITNTFEDLPVSKRTLYCYMANLWVFILEKVRLGSVERNTPEKIQTRTEWVEMVNNLGVDYMANSVSIDKSGFAQI